MRRTRTPEAARVLRMMERLSRTQRTVDLIARTARLLEPAPARASRHAQAAPPRSPRPARRAARGTRTQRRGPPRPGGEDDSPLPRRPGPLDRFFAKVELTLFCWEWLGAVGSSGYGVFHVGPGLELAHRYAYEALVGPIPDDHDLDHLCGNTRCVNPAHLEPVTRAENVRRAAERRRRGAA
jgi:hypothetical protein